MKLLIGTLTLALTTTTFANVHCKLIQSNSRGEVFDTEMAYLNGATNHKFFKSGSTTYLVEVNKKNNDIRVEVKNGEELVLSSWSSFDSAGVMQIERKESDNLYTMIYCQK